jgi:hypothetical protein
MGAKKTDTVKISKDTSELEELRQLIKIQQEQINNLLKSDTAKVSQQPFIEKDPFDANRLVTVIHMDDLVDGLTTTVKGDTEYKFNRIGDKFRIRLIELEKIMASYKKFFERGFLLIADDDINEYFALNNDSFISIDTFKNIYKLGIDDLKKVYETVCAAHKDMILRHWFVEYEKGEKIEYKDYGKISILNQCSGNKLQSLIEDLNQRNFYKKK